MPTARAETGASRKECRIGADEWDVNQTGDQQHAAGLIVPTAMEAAPCPHDLERRKGSPAADRMYLLALARDDMAVSIIVWISVRVPIMPGIMNQRVSRFGLYQARVTTCTDCAGRRGRRSKRR